MTYSMQLNELLSELVVIESNVDDISDIVITELVLDSRKVSTGSLFFAYPGVAHDGRDFIDAAQAAGASAILYEEGIDLPEAITIPAFAIGNLQVKVGEVAHHFYQQPSTELQVFGVTGTNGKTTCCYLLTQALEMMGMQAAMIGTIGIGQLASLDSASHTTPDPVELHRLLAQFRDAGMTQVCMEVSSHALDQGRVNGVQFFCTLFTNLSHDHLDYHGDMESYANAKRRLFTNFHSELVIANAADPVGAGLTDIANADFIVTYGVGGDVFADDIELSASGIEFVIEGNGVEIELSTPLIGKVNIQNLELLIATLLALSTSIEDISSIVSQLKPAPGRMELIQSENRASVVIDYAHTPDALEKALLSVKEHCSGQLWCVFGCGGDRDQAKRPLMGQMADKYADRVIVTNDNPRSEVPSDIADQITAGINGEFDVVLDRAHAIATGIERAAQNDWLLIAGKGHETTQTIGESVLPFSDRQQVLSVFEGGNL